MAVTKNSTNSLQTFAKFNKAGAGNYAPQFLATTATSGTVLTSPDGITWTTRTTGLPASQTNAPHRVGANYVVIDGSYFNRWTSADGVSWAKTGTVASNYAGSTASYMYGARYNAVDNTWNTFPTNGANQGNIGAGFDATNGFALSDNAVTLNNWGGSGYATNGSVFIFSGGNAASTGTAPYLTKSTTTKGGTQSAQAYGASTFSLGCDYGNGQFAVIANNGTGIYTSPDGVTWTSRGTTANGGIIYLNGLWLAWQSTNLWTTANATSGWTSRTVTGISTNSIQSIAYGAGLYVIVAQGGFIATSPDGTTWTSRTSGVAGTITGVMYG